MASPTELYIIRLVLSMESLLVAIPFWKICTKPGRAGPLSLLMLIPMVNIALLFYIAFAP